MGLPVIMDATPLGGGHGGRGIGAATAGVIEGFAQLPEAERPALLTRVDETVHTGFRRVDLTLGPWRLARAGVPDPRPARRARRTLAGHAFEVFHATQPGLEAARGMTCVETCYDLIPLLFPGEYLAGPRRVLERRAYDRYLRRLRHAARVVVNTHAVARDVVNLAGVDGRRVRVVPLAVPPIAESVAEPPAQTDPYILYSGSVEPHKNVGLLVDALGRSRHPALRLRLTGPWSRRRLADLCGRIDAAGLTARVDLMGHVTAPQLAALRKGAVGVAVPSLSEGFGLPVLEAMAAGVPVVCSTAPALVEVSGGACPAVDPHDAGAWADALDALVDDAGARQRLARDGRARAALFAWKATAERLADVYREVMV